MKPASTYHRQAMRFHALHFRVWQKAGMLARAKYHLGLAMLNRKRFKLEYERKARP